MQLGRHLPEEGDERPDQLRIGPRQLSGRGGVLARGTRNVPGCRQRRAYGLRIALLRPDLPEVFSRLDDQPALGLRFLGR